MATFGWSLGSATVCLLGPLGLYLFTCALVPSGIGLSDFSASEGCSKPGCSLRVLSLCWCLDQKAQCLNEKTLGLLTFHKGQA